MNKERSKDEIRFRRGMIILILSLLVPILLFGGYYLFSFYAANQFADSVGDLSDRLRKRNIHEGEGLLQENTFSIDCSCPKHDSFDRQSYLERKLALLKNLDQKYQIIEIGELELEESQFYDGMTKLQTFSSDRAEFEIANVEKMRESILNVRYGLIKGRKDLGGQTYARARVEEVIFRSRECALRFSMFVNEIREGSRYWEDIEKSPSLLFDDVNRIYYIVTGGHYMQPFYRNIENGMQK